MKNIAETWMESFLPLFLLFVFVLVSILVLDNKAEKIVKSYEEIQLVPSVTGMDSNMISADGEVILENSSLADSTKYDPIIQQARQLTRAGDLRGAENLLRKAIATRQQQHTGNTLSDDPDISLRLQLGVTLIRRDKLKDAEALYDQMINEQVASVLIYYNRALLRTRLEKLAGAEKDYRSALLLKPSHFESMFNLGLLQMERGFLQDAQKCLSSAHKLAPGMSRAKAYFALGQVWTKMNKPENARRSYLMAIDYQPDYLLPRYNLALLGISKGDRAGLQEARKYLDRIEALQPDFAPVKFLRGRLASQAGYDITALKWYQMAARLDPGFYKARYNIGIVALRLGHLNLAHTEFIRLKDDFPKRPQPEFNLGKLAYQRHQYDQALKHYQQALNISGGDYDEAKSNIGLVMQALGQLDEALAVFDSLLAKQPDNASFWLNRALVLMRKGQLDSAEESLRHAIAIKPKLVSAHYNLGKLSAKKKRYEQAENTYAKVLQLQPKHLKAAVNRGVMLSKLERFDDAITAYRFAVSIAPSHVPAHYNLAMALRKRNRLEEARSEYEIILELDGEHSGALLNLGVVYSKMGKSDRAAELFDKALDYEPGNYKTRFNLALQLKKMDRLEEAKVEFQKVLQLNKKHLGATRSLASLLYKQGRLEEAIVWAKRAVAISPDEKTTRKLESYQAMRKENK